MGDDGGLHGNAHRLFGGVRLLGVSAPKGMGASGSLFFLGLGPGPQPHERKKGGPGPKPEKKERPRSAHSRAETPRSRAPRRAEYVPGRHTAATMAGQTRARTGSSGVPEGVTP